MVKKQSSLYNLKHKEGRDVAPETMSPPLSHSLPTNQNCVHKMKSGESNNNDDFKDISPVRSMQSKNWQLVGNIASPGWLFEKSMVEDSKAQCKAFVPYQ